MRRLWRVRPTLWLATGLTVLLLSWLYQLTPGAVSSRPVPTCPAVPVCHDPAGFTVISRGQYVVHLYDDGRLVRLLSV